MCTIYNYWVYVAFKTNLGYTVWYQLVFLGGPFSLVDHVGDYYHVGLLHRHYF